MTAEQRKAMQRVVSSLQGRAKREFGAAGHLTVPWPRRHEAVENAIACLKAAQLLEQHLEEVRSLVDDAPREGR